MKSSENSFETPKGCLSSSVRLGNHFFPNSKQKKTFFLKKVQIFSFGKCIVPKNMKGGPFGIYYHSFRCKIWKTRKGDPIETFKKNRKKVAQCRKKIERGDSLVSSGFVGYLKKVKKMKGGLSLHRPDLVIVVSGISLRSGSISVKLKEKRSL